MNQSRLSVTQLLTDSSIDWKTYPPSKAEADFFKCTKSWYFTKKNIAN